MFISVVGMWDEFCVGGQAEEGLINTAFWVLKYSFSVSIRVAWFRSLHSMIHKHTQLIIRHGTHLRTSHLTVNADGSNDEYNWSTGDR